MNLISLGFWPLPTFLHFLKKVVLLQSISFELSKGSLEKELLCYQKRAYCDSLVWGENSSPMGQDYHIAAFANPGNLKKSANSIYILNSKCFRSLDFRMRAKSPFLALKFKLYWQKKNGVNIKFNLGQFFAQKLTFFHMKTENSIFSVAQLQTYFWHLPCTCFNLVL